ncbi:hypothetical protein [Streptomyces sp. B27]|uniref:hypothetical protein n=1 Tax=Streptomyces sp. B27 TaxID=2485015 RepID=UPI000FD7A5B8|nr:hypothetical protein [Streptomyces sp. B27]
MATVLMIASLAACGSGSTVDGSGPMEGKVVSASPSAPVWSDLDTVLEKEPLVRRALPDIQAMPGWRPKVAGQVSPSEESAGQARLRGYAKFTSPADTYVSFTMISFANKQAAREYLKEEFAKIDKKQRPNLDMPTIGNESRAYQPGGGKVTMRVGTVVAEVSAEGKAIDTQLLRHSSVMFAKRIEQAQKGYPVNASLTGA